jgi:hypothetical protein
MKRHRIAPASPTAAPVILKEVTECISLLRDAVYASACASMLAA